MQLALSVPKDSQWTRYKEDPNLLSDNTWIELALILKNQELEAIDLTSPKY